MNVTSHFIRFEKRRFLQCIGNEINPVWKLGFMLFGKPGDLEQPGNSACIIISSRLTAADIIMSAKTF